MKVNTKSRYALRMLIDLAKAFPDHAILLKDIAQSEDISEKYLSQIVISLKKAGIITTFSGAHSGYILCKSPEEILMKDIFEIFEGISIIECLDNEDFCGKQAHCLSIRFWGKLNDSINKVLETTTLQDLIKT